MRTKKSAFDYDNYVFGEHCDISLSMTIIVEIWSRSCKFLKYFSCVIQCIQVYYTSPWQGISQDWFANRSSFWYIRQNRTTIWSSMEKSHRCWCRCNRCRLSVCTIHSFYRDKGCFPSSKRQMIYNIIIYQNHWHHYIILCLAGKHWRITKCQMLIFSQALYLKLHQI